MIDGVEGEVKKELGRWKTMKAEIRVPEKISNVMKSEPSLGRRRRTQKFERKKC